MFGIVEILSESDLARSRCKIITEDDSGESGFRAVESFGGENLLRVKYGRVCERLAAH